VLTRLEMADSSPGGEIAPLLAAVRASTTLTWLDLSAAGLSDESVVPLGAAGALELNLEGLVLARNRIGPKGAVALAAMLAVCRKLRVLDLADNKLGGVGASLVATALRAHAALTSLKLDSNGIGAAGMAALADLYPPVAAAVKSVLKAGEVANASVPEQVLQHQQRFQRPLQAVSLSNNGLEWQAGADIATLIARAPSLARLDLSVNILRDQGVMAIAGSLASEACQIRTLNISNNWLSDTAAVTLASALERNRTLKHIDISSNRQVAGVGCDALSAALDSNTVVEHIVIEFTSVPYRSHERLAAKLRRNRQFAKRGFSARIATSLQGLEGDKTWLCEVSDKVDVARQGFQEKQRQLENATAELSAAEASATADKEDIERLMEERTELVHQVVASCASLSAELHRVKQDKELSYRTLLQRLHREKESCRGAQRRVADAERRLDEFLIDAREEVAKLESGITVETVEKMGLQSSVRKLRSQIDTLRQRRQASVANAQQINVAAESPKRSSQSSPPLSPAPPRPTMTFLSRVAAASRPQSGAVTASSPKTLSNRDRPGSSVPKVEIR
jgi:Ran GTPase-activating protein (RanGAP) involved in mRNA processing and transport